MDQLILKCLQGEASEKEYSKVWGWLKANKENYDYYVALRDIWIASGLIQEVPAITVDKNFEKLQQRLDEKKTGLWEPRKSLLINSLVFRIAAVFVIAFFLGGLVFNSFNKVKSYSNNQYEVEAPLGAKVKMNLIDGTKVWLNAGSKLIYSENYNKKERYVKLFGEGYFEVAKNENIPFFVDAYGVKVKAVGTAFNVKAYPDEDAIETTLVEGKVTISEGKQTITLEPSQKASFIRKSKQFNITSNNEDAKENKTEHQVIKNIPRVTERIVLSKNVNTDLYTSWRSKRWVFESEKMEDLAIKLERLYDVKISFKDSELKEYKLSGSIEQQTLTQLLDAIRLTVPLKYTIEKEQVVLSIDKELAEKYKSLMN